MQVDFLLLSVGYMTREVKSLTGGGEVRGIGSESGLLDQLRFINHNLFFWSFLIFPSTLLFPRHHLCQLNWLRPGVVWCPLMLQWSRTLTHSFCDRTCLYIRIQRCLKKYLKAAFSWNPFKFLLFTIFHQGFYLNILRPWAESLFFFFFLILVWHILNPTTSFSLVQYECIDVPRRPTQIFFFQPFTPTQIQLLSSPAVNRWHQIHSAETLTRTRRVWDQWPSATCSLWPGRKVRAWRPLRLRASPLLLHPYPLWSSFSHLQNPNKVCLKAEVHKKKKKKRIQFPKGLHMWPIQQDIMMSVTMNNEWLCLGEKNRCRLCVVTEFNVLYHLLYVAFVISLEPFVWTVEPTKEELSEKLNTTTRSMEHMNSLLHETEATNAILMEQITVCILPQLYKHRNNIFLLLLKTKLET